MQVIRNYTGLPPPALHEGPPLHIQAGDTIELLRGDAHSLFWQVFPNYNLFKRFSEWFITAYRMKLLSFRNWWNTFSFRDFAWCERKKYVLAFVIFTNAEIAVNINVLKK